MTEAEEDARIQSKFTEEVLRALRADDAEMDAGNYYDNDQVSEFIANLHEAWLKGQGFRDTLESS